MTNAVSEAFSPGPPDGIRSRLFDAPASTDAAENAIQPSDTAKKKIIKPCSSVMLAKRTTCSIWYVP